MSDEAAPFNLCTELLEHNLAAGRGDKVALVVDRAGRAPERWTYAELADAVRRLQSGLIALGVEPENRVLLVLPDVAEFAVAWFATVRAGAVAVAVSAELKSEDLAYYLDYTRAKVVVVADTTSERLRAALDGQRYLKAVVEVDTSGERRRELSAAAASVAGKPAWHPYESLLEHAPAAEPWPTTRDDVGVWLFTSGSTGRPKAAVHRHEDFVWNAERYAIGTVGYREDDLTCGVPKLFFGYALGTNLLFPFRVGASTVLFPERSTPDRLWQIIEAHRPTVLTTVPTMIAAMSEATAGLGPEASRARAGRLRFAVSAGEALPDEIYQRWKTLTGVEIYDGIGSAEMFHIFITNRPGDVVPGSLGRIVDGYEARVCDDDGNPVPDGEIGTLWVRGRSTGLGYFGRRDASVHTFRGEWCVSADKFVRDARGYYFYQGRADDLLKVGGRFLAPLEVENCLLAHPAVAEVAVIGVKDDEGLTKPKAFVVVRPGHEAGASLAEALQRWVKERLQPYKYPREVAFVEALPRNDRGKVDRRRLAEGAA